jgi:electron transport complex protein RnfB
VSAAASPSSSTLQPADLDALEARIDAALPQTQCTRCGYEDCRAYAQAVAHGEAGINQCPPGGQQGVERLAAITGRPVLPLNPANGLEGPLRLARIDESWCIGCTLCIKACPVDCIIGAPKQMHVVIESQCTGCELCVPACPVDCIQMADTGNPAIGWAAWSPARADEARERYAFHRERVARDKRENDERLAAKAEAKLADVAAASRHTDAVVLDRKRQVIEAALARARARLNGPR